MFNSSEGSHLWCFIIVIIITIIIIVVVVVVVIIIICVRHVVSAHWTGFHDSQSGLRHYVVFSGSSRNSSDISLPVTLPANSSRHVQLLTTPLSAGSRIYFTVVAYNQAGESSRASSNGIIVDFSTPLSLQAPSIQTGWVGSTVSHAQLSSSSLQMSWNFSDNTALQYYYLSLLSDTGTSIPIPPQIVFLQSSQTFSQLALSDGDSYRILVRGCDVGGVCASATSESVLIDSSPPIDGYFLVNGLNSNISAHSWRNRPVRNTAEISLAVFGFSDPHSSPLQYWARAGSQVGGSSLMDVTLLPASPQNGNTFSLVLALNRQLIVSEVLHVTLWAENGAGLESRTIQGSFIVDDPFQTNRGSLMYVRSPCLIDSCMGHCSCAARGDLCNVPLSTLGTCERLNHTSLSPSMMVQVYNVVPQLVTTPTGRLVTSIADKLYGRWEYDSSANFRRVEWSVGVEGEEPGAGLIDIVNEEVWYTATSNMSAVFTVSKTRPLVEFQTYVFYVRVWYSFTTYAIFTSSSLGIDWSRPRIAQGRRVSDIVGGSMADIDFTHSETSLSMSWTDVFVSDGNMLEVGLGDTPASDNVYRLTSVVAMATSYNITGLDLEEGVVYYGMVRATDSLGKTTVSVSDGVTTDLTPPQLGVVLSGRGRGYSSIHAQSFTNVFTVRWFGFSDSESSIDHYEATFTNSRDPPSSYDNVSVSLWTSFTDLTLTQGLTYYAHVVAVNGAGLRSHDIVSDGVMVQTMQPEARECESSIFASLTNPSFDGSSTSTSQCTPTDVAMATMGWVVNASYVTVSSYPETPPIHGCHSIGIIGSISQTFVTTPATSYTLEFSYTIFHGNDLAGVRVQLPGVDELLTPPYRDQVQRWYSGRVQFVALERLSQLTVSSAFTDSVVHVDNIVIATCTSHTQLTPATLPQAIRLTPTLISGSRVKLSAEWNVVDELVGVKEYLWSIGTVARGGQLQPYRSTGHVQTGVSDYILVSQGQEVFVTVVARSNSGRELMVNSTGYMVDLTVPTERNHTHLIWDGAGPVDVDYQSGAMVAVNWAGLAAAQELLSCAWSVGKN